MIILMGRIVLASVGLLLLPVPLALAAEGASQVIADFDKTSPGEIRTYDDVISVEPADGATGRALKVLPGRAAGAKPGLLVRLTGVTLPASGHFRCAIKVSSKKPQVVVRWIVRRDADAAPARQVKMAVSSEDGWKQVDVPIHEWRWGNESVGDLSEGRELVLLADENADELRVDDVRIDPLAANEETPVAWLRRQAFGGDRDARLIERNGLIVATDVPAHALTQADLDRLVANLVRGRKFVARAFGNAVRPIDDGTPPALLIFRDPAEMAAFWNRIGQQWGATINPPRNDGYTVYDIATSSYDAKAGAERPVYLHEAIHAIVGHDVRLLTGTRHSWLQEGIANYLQLCVYPQSLKEGALARAFAAKRGEARSLFQPIDMALGPSNDTRLHAQRATIVGYLIHEKPQWLPVIAKSLAGGASIDDALRRCETTPAALEEDWRKWGRNWFEHRDPADGVHFPLPKEWREPPVP